MQFSVEINDQQLAGSWVTVEEAKRSVSKYLYPLKITGGSLKEIRKRKREDNSSDFDTTREYSSFDSESSEEDSSSDINGEDFPGSQGEGEVLPPFKKQKIHNNSQETQLRLNPMNSQERELFQKLFHEPCCEEKGSEVIEVESSQEDMQREVERKEDWLDIKKWEKEDSNTYRKKLNGHWVILHRVNTAWKYEYKGQVSNRSYFMLQTQFGILEAFYTAYLNR